MKRNIATLLTPMIAGTLAMFHACTTGEDYSQIVFRNYLTYEVNRATTVLNSSVEGDLEGEYHTGSKQVYQEVISWASGVAGDQRSGQKEIDGAYADLLKAADQFFDEMVPFRSGFNIWIDYARILLATTEEGQEEGNVKPGSKEALQSAVGTAENTVAMEDLTQRELDVATADLTSAVYSFNSSINGRAYTAVRNPGFEHPGYVTEDFSEVEGWDLYGRIESWAPKASILQPETAPEGQFVARIGSYTQGMIQTLPELVNPGATYTLDFMVSLLSNGGDWQGKKFPAILRTRLVVFEEEPGDFDFMDVLIESYDTLGINPTGYLEKSYSVKMDAISASIGKPLTILFEQRHTWNSENPIWAESFVALDDVKLYRKL